MLVTMNFNGGGGATLAPSLPNCYLGQTCTFSNFATTYTLPDGSTAQLTNFRASSRRPDRISHSPAKRRAATVWAQGLRFTHQRPNEYVLNRGCTKTYLGGSLRIRTA
jgi:hypothetical protein